MGLGLSLPWMLCWLATATIPLVLARHALRRPRLVRWGPTDLLAGSTTVRLRTPLPPTAAAGS
jgi:hypothetical protein